MLTRLKVDGFKNLLGVDISFGPFTCIAGANGVGKSNLFDAIRFLSTLSEKSLIEAALSVRGEAGRGLDLKSLFHRVGLHQSNEIRFEAEMLVPGQGIDDLGQEAKATIRFLRYELILRITPSGMEIRKEELRHITKGKSRAHLLFPHSKAWRDSVIQGRRTSPFISTETSNGQNVIKLHQDGGKDYLGGGRPRPHTAAKLPRTVLSGATKAAESPTAVLARREMQSWRLLQLEPSALRNPDSFTSPSTVAANGAHLPATLARLSRWADLEPGRLHRMAPEDSAGPEAGNYAEAVYASVANRLSELIEEVHSIRIEADESRDLLKLMLRDHSGTEHEARALSDGTLRFLALAILEQDPSAGGVLCLEEPENGIHPERIPAMLRLLRDLATDSMEKPSGETSLKQVIVNTHSPAVVGQVRSEDLLVVTPEVARIGGRAYSRPVFRWLEGTWRANAQPEVRPVAPGIVVNYLNPIEPPEGRGNGGRVLDRPEIQLWLPLELTPA